MPRRRWLLAIVGLVVASGWQLSHPPTAKLAAALPGREPRGAANDRLIVAPDDGMTPIYDLLRSPRRRLDMTMYSLSDPTAEAILAADVARGVRVRVVLDGGLEHTHNQP